MPTARPAGVLAPERLDLRHDLSQFRNGKHSSLDDWLRDRALASEGLSARTYVIYAAEEGMRVVGRVAGRVVGYYALSTAMARRTTLPSAKLRRGMPDEIPLLLIGRLAIDVNYQGRGLGTDLLADALHRCLAATDIAGARAIVTHAIDDDAASFYERHGFLRSPLGERTLLMPIEMARGLVE